MKKIPLIYVFILLSPVKLWSQVPDNENFIVTHGPWLQNPGPTAVTIMWTTNKPAIPGITVSGPDGNRRLVRNSTDGIVDGGGTLHKVKVSGLQPGTEYKYNLHSVQVLKYQAYKVYYGDTLQSRALSYKAPPENSDKISFTVYNDVHELSAKLGTYYRNGTDNEQDLFFFNGDMLDYLQNTDQIFKGFIDTAVHYFASTKPFYYVRGNHETRGYLARDIKKYFDYPGDRFYYSFDRGPVHFTILDCGEDKPDNNRYYYGLADYDTYRLEQLEWLKQEVRSEAFKKAKYRIVLVHMPILKQEKQGWGMAFLANNFGPVLQGTGVNLMLSAHTHRNAYYEKEKSGFGYPLLVNSNNSFIELSAGPEGIRASVRDTAGKLVAEYNIK